MPSVMFASTKCASLPSSALTIDTEIPLCHYEGKHSSQSETTSESAFHQPCLSRKTAVATQEASSQAFAIQPFRYGQYQAGAVMAAFYVFLILLLRSATSLATICPPGWHRYAESCYYYILNPLDWNGANIICAEMHGRLAIPRCKMEQSFVWNTYVDILQANGQTIQQLWFGCNDIEEEGNWQQCPLVEDSAGYQNWASGEPNDRDGAQDCALMRENGGGLWYDHGCTASTHAVCQRPAYTSSTPAYCLHTGPDGRISSQCLLGHVVKELPADGVLSCGKACCLEPRCQSFNLLDQEGRGEEMTCQLNNVTSDIADEGDFDETENCFSFDIQRSACNYF